MSEPYKSYNPSQTILLSTPAKAFIPGPLHSVIQVAINAHLRLFAGK